MSVWPCTGSTTYSSPTSKNGVGLLIYTSISPNMPSLKIHIPCTLIYTQLHLHPAPQMPPISITSYYGPRHP